MVKRVLLLVAVIALLQGITAGTPAAANDDCSSGWIALTYDDGPIPKRTGAVMAALEKADIPATFFTIGNLVDRYPEWVRKEAAKGHVVANHTYWHEYLVFSSNSSIVKTINHTDAAIRAAGVDAARLVRPPGGNTNARVRSAIEGAGFVQVMWTWGPLDYRPISASTIARGVINHARDGAVIVLHDGSGNYRNTAAATIEIARTLKSKGYCFGVLDERGRVRPPEPEFPSCLNDGQAAPGTDIFVIGGTAVISDDVQEYFGECTSGNITRLAGHDRYATAAALADQFYPDGSDIAYIATGQNFPDALSVGPSAARVNAPLLLTGATNLPAVTRSALEKLAPSQIVIVGGTAAISEGVASELEGIAPVTRLAGPDRYATAAEVSSASYPDGADVAVIASGVGFFDALVTGSVAVHNEAPMLLTAKAGLPPATAAELARLTPSKVLIAGGTAVISAEVEAEITALLPGVTIERIAGSSRYSTAIAAAKASNLDGPHRVFFFTEKNFPDGLAAVAAAKGSPLLPVDVRRINEAVAKALTSLFG